MPKLLIQIQGHSSRIYDLTSKEAVIGRGQDAELQLADASVSRHHCKLTRKGTTYQLADLGSQNGTTINKKKAKGGVTLKHGDEIQVGKFLLIYREEPSTQAIPKKGRPKRGKSKAAGGASLLQKIDAPFEDEGAATSAFTKEQMVEARKSALVLGEAPKVTRSIKLTVPLAVVVPALIGVAVTGAISLESGRRSIEDLSAHLNNEVTDGIVSELEGHMALPLRLIELNADTLEYGQFDPSVDDNWRLMLWRQAQLIDSLNYIGFGRADGGFVGVQVMDGRYMWHASQLGAEGSCWDYWFEEDGSVGEFGREEVGYDPTQRDWYKGGVQAGAAIWSPIYWSFTHKIPAMTLAKPHHSPTGELMGVLAVNMSFRGISAFLRSLDLEFGEAMVVERGGTLVATSLPIEDLDTTSEQSLRFADSEHPLISATAAHLGDLTELTESASAFVFDGTEYLVQVAPIEAGAGIDWAAVVVIRRDAFMGPIEETQRVTILLAIMTLLLTAWLGLRISGRMVTPLLRLSRAANELKAKSFDASKLDDLAQRPDEVGELAQRFQNMVHAVIAREMALAQTNQAISRFVPHDFLRLLRRTNIREIERGDHIRIEMEILFCDLRSFTTLIESMDADTAFAFINRYLSYMEPEIHAVGGFINQYLGDCIMALFPEGAESALKGAVGMQRALVRFNEEQEQRGDEPIKVGIGINTGSLMMGTIGGLDRLDAGVIGDPVNLAARIEGMTKIYSVPLLISGETRARLRSVHAYAMRQVDRVIAKGKTEPIELWEVLDGLEESVQAARRSTRGPFKQGRDHYTAGRFSEAAEAFDEVVRMDPTDACAATLAANSRELAANPPEEWAGVTVLKTK